MAWLLKNLENALESVDKSAATKITAIGGESVAEDSTAPAAYPSTSADHLDSHEDAAASIAFGGPAAAAAAFSTAIASQPTWQVPPNTTPSRPTRFSQRPAQPSAAPVNNTKAVRDEDLFDFLNSPSKLPAAAQESPAPVPVMTSSGSALKRSEEAPQKQPSPPPLVSSTTLPDTGTVVAVPAPAPSADSNSTQLLEQNATLQMANKLMRSEMKGLNDEINKLSERVRQQQMALDQRTASEQQAQQQLAATRKRADEAELALASVKVQAHQAESLGAELRGRDNIIRDLQEKLDRARKEVSALQDAHQHKATDESAALQEERAAHLQAQKVAQERESALLAQITELTGALTKAERSAEERNSESQSAQQRARTAEADARSLRQELTDYKNRAAKVLASKEKALEELSTRLSAGTAASGTTVPLAEHVQLQQERDMFKSEAGELRQTVEQLRHTVSEMQAQAADDTRLLKTQCQDLEEKLEKEKRRVQALQIELVARTQEATAAREQHDRATREADEQLQQRDTELTQLRKAAANKDPKPSAAAAAAAQQEQKYTELESRLRASTEHLINKQAQIDQLVSEKQALQVRWETLVQQLNEQQQKAKVPPANTGAVSISIDEDSPASRGAGGVGGDASSGMRLRPISSLAPALAARDSAIARRVVRAANLLDSVSASAGNLLRHSPLARLCFMLYLVLLHVWVCYVTAYLSPETHTAEQIQAWQGPHK